MLLRCAQKYALLRMTVELLVCMFLRCAQKYAPLRMTIKGQAPSGIEGKNIGFWRALVSCSKA
jgi:hypothetical protein